MKSGRFFSGLGAAAVALLVLSQAPATVMAETWICPLWTDDGGDPSQDRWFYVDMYDHDGMGNYTWVDFGIEFDTHPDFPFCSPYDNPTCCHTQTFAPGKPKNTGGKNRVTPPCLLSAPISNPDYDYPFPQPPNAGGPNPDWSVKRKGQPRVVEIQAPGMSTFPNGERTIRAHLIRYEIKVKVAGGRPEKRRDVLIALHCDDSLGEPEEGYVIPNDHSTDNCCWYGWAVPGQTDPNTPHKKKTILLFVAGGNCDGQQGPEKADGPAKKPRKAQPQKKSDE